MADVLIFDDDPAVGDLLGELLRVRGLTVAHYLSGAGVVSLVEENKPRLVVLDIMMPGMDGLAALRELKASPTTKGTKVAILTAKNYAEDQAIAAKHGADLFLHKPFDPKMFAGSIGRLLGLPDAKDPPKPPAAPIVVTILPGCALVETAGLLVVLDAGEGLRSWVEKQAAAPPLVWVLVSRYQKESVSEIASLARFVGAGSKVCVAGPDDSESTLQQMSAPMCATSSDKRRLTPLLYPQREGEFAPAPGARVVTRLTQHPGACLAYRIELAGRKLVWCPAHEIHPDLPRLNKHEYGKFRDLFKKADLLMHGYRRSLVDEPPKDAKGAGAWEPVVDLAAEAGVDRIALLPMTHDAPTDGVQFRIEERLAIRDSPLRFGVTRFHERVIL